MTQRSETHPDGAGIGGIAWTPVPPYWAVVFTSLQTGDDLEGYAVTSEQMVALVAGQPGFLGLETARGSDGLGITVAYFEDRDAIRAWREHAEHRIAQQLGREKWYRAYALRTCRVEAERSWQKPDGQGTGAG